MEFNQKYNTHIIPNFLIAGVNCGGTSFLSAALATHPEIYLPKSQRPEPNFFHYSWKFKKGIEWYSQKWFSQVTGEKAIGERSSLLLTSSIAAQRMKDLIGDTKLIFCLRNPIERAWANYRFTVLEGLEHLPFNVALDKEVERRQTAEGIWTEVLPYAYLERSCYADPLLKYIKLFGRKKILILCSEELGEKPQRTISDICRFISVDPEFNVEIPVNYTSPTVFNPEVQKELRTYFGNRFGQIIECVRKGTKFDQLILNKEDQTHIHRLQDNISNVKEPLSKINRVKLKGLLNKEIKRVSKIVDFSVSHWI